MDFGIGEAVSGLAGGIFGALGQKETNQANAQNAWQSFLYQTAMQKDQQAYNTQMANTQYQRTMADMRAAGLNPILAAGGFSPDSANSGQGSAPGPAAYSSPTSAAVSTGGQLAKLLAELKQIDQHIQKTGAETTLTDAQTDTERTKPALTRAQTKTEKERPQQVRTQSYSQSAHGSHAEAQRDRVNAELKDYKRGGSGQISFTLPGRMGSASVPISVLQRFGIDGTRKLLGLSGAENASPAEPPSSAKGIEDRAKALGAPSFQKRRSDGAKHETRAN